jgi:hypothetical protein
MSRTPDKRDDRGALAGSRPRENYSIRSVVVLEDLRLLIGLGVVFLRRLTMRFFDNPRDSTLGRSGGAPANQ